MNAKVGALNVDLTLETARFEQGLNRSVSSAKAAEGQIQQIANRWGVSLDRVGQSANGVVGPTDRARAGMQQLSFQLGDVATMWAMGARPMQIFASQAGQVVQAVQLMSAGTSRLGAFIAGPWGVALTGAAIVVGTLASRLGETEQGMQDVKFASDAMKDAQGILSGVMDITTGKINTQNQALVALAQAQILVAKVQAQARAATARSGVQSMQDRPLQIAGGIGGGVSLQRRPADARDAISQQVLAGQLDAKTAIQRLENLRRVGRITDAEFTSYSASIANMGLEQQNIRVFDEADKLLRGTGGTGLLRAPRSTGGGGGSSAGRSTASRSAPAAESDLSSWRQYDFNATFAPFEKLAKGHTLEDIDQQMADLTQRSRDLKVEAKETAASMHLSFKDAAQGITASLSSLASAMQGGNFLSILSGVLDLGVKLAGAGLFGSKIAGNINGGSRIPAYATGTDWHPGGLALVGERGPEVVNLPRGAQVYPNGTGPGGAVKNYYFSGNLLTPEFWSEIEKRDRVAAAAGAHGGVKLMNRARARTL